MMLESMFGSVEGQRRVGRLAWWMAWFGLVLGQLHALARHQTADGKGDLESGIVRAWSDPARDLLSPLLGWASPDTVYLTYGKLWLPVFLAFTACAFVVRRRRRPTGAEKWAWRLTLTAFVGACVSVGAEYWTQWTAVDDSLMDPIFLASLPFVVFTMLGSTFLGVVLLVRRDVGLPAILLTLAVPGMVLIPTVTSMGSVVLPIAFAFGILGRRIARSADATAPAEVVTTTQSA